MSKVIRTGRVSGNAVTLGRADDDLYLKGEEEEVLVDVSEVLRTRVEAEVTALNEAWEARLRQEHETMRSAAERQLQEAEERRQAEVERVSQERYEEGFKDGVGSKEAEAREAVERLAAVHDSLKQERHQVLMEAEGLVVDLALALARRVTGIQAETDRRVLVKVMRTALEHLADRDNLVIKVHQGDLQVARKFADHWVSRVDADAVIRIVASQQVERGGCMIEGREESIDARLGEQLSVIEAALRGAAFSSGAQATDATSTAAPSGASTPAVEQSPGDGEGEAR